MTSACEFLSTRRRYYYCDAFQPHRHIDGNLPLSALVQVSSTAFGRELKADARTLVEASSPHFSFDQKNSMLLEAVSGAEKDELSW